MHRKKWIKYTLLSVCAMLLLSVVTVAVLLITLNDEDFRNFLSWGVRTFTDFKLSVDGPLSLDLSLEPSLSASDIHIRPDEAEAPQFKSDIDKLRVQIALLPLLSGDIVIRDLDMQGKTFSFFTEDDDQEEQKEEQEIDIEIPIFESVTMRDITINVTDRETGEVENIYIHDFNIDDLKDTGPLRIRGKGTVNDTVITVGGQLGPVADALKGVKDYPVELKLNVADLDLSVSGTVDDVTEGTGLDLHLSGEAPDLTKVLKILKAEVPQIRRMNLQARITGDAVAPTVSGLDLLLSGKDLNLSARGSVSDIVSGEGLDLQVTADSPELSVLLHLWDQNIPELGQLKLNATVRGDAPSPNITDLTMVLSGQDINLSAKGSMTSVVTGRESGVVLSASTANRALIRHFLPKELHDLSSLSLEGAVNEVQGAYRIENIAFTASQKRGLTGTIQGSFILDDAMESPSIRQSDLRLKIASPNMKPFRHYLPDRIPDAGPVTATAKLSGEGKTLSLNEINIRIGREQRLQMTAAGRVGSIPFQFDRPISDFDVMLSILSKNLQPMLTGLTDSIREWDSISARAHVTGSSGLLQFDQIAIHLEEEEGASADITGNVRVKQRPGQSPLIRMDLHPTFYGQSLASFRNLLAAQALPDLKPAKASGRIKGTAESFSLEDILIQAGHPGPLNFKWQGRIGKVAIGSDQPVTDVRISSSIYAENTTLLSPYVGISVPDLGPLESTSQIVGRRGGYGADNINLLIGKGRKSQFKAKGSIAYLMKGSSVGLKGIELDVDIPRIEGKLFGELLGEHAEQIGSLSGGFSVSGEQTDLTLSDINLSTTSPDRLNITARGKISHIRAKEKMPLQGLEITVTASSPQLTTVEKIGGIELPELGPLKASMKVNDRNQALAVDPFVIRTGPEKKPTLLVEGSLQDILSGNGIDGTVTFKTTTRPWVEKLRGRPGPEDHQLQGKIDFRGTKERTNIDGTIGIGKTELTVTAGKSHNLSRPQITGTLSSPKIHLSDIEIYGETPQADREKKKKAGPVKRLFSDEPIPFEKLNNLDFSLAIDADELIGKGFVLNDLNFDSALDKGTLKNHLRKLTFADGFVEIQSSITTGGEKPEITLKVTAEDIDVQELQSHAHAPLILGGHLNLAIDLRSSGRSPREIASALNGDIGIAIENGQIQRIAELLGADAIDLLTASRSLRNYQRLNCLAVKFGFKDGLGTSEVLYLDTQRVRSQGTGTIDLREETLDLVIQPRRRGTRIGGSSAVRIRGPITRPSASTLPLREAARLSGEILMPFVFLPARALGHVGSLMRNDRDESSPCFRPESEEEPKDR